MRHIQSLASTQYEGGENVVNLVNNMEAPHNNSQSISDQSQDRLPMDKTLSQAKFEFNMTPGKLSVIKEQESGLVTSANPTEMDIFTRIVHSFSLTHAYEYLAGSRCKPWENRELDVLDGFKTFSFLLYSIAQTSVFLSYTSLLDIFQLFLLLRRIEVAAFIASNLALETFVFVSAFFGAYRCFQIMEARGGLLTAGDILKLYARKFLRLAPPYYLMWFVLWGLTPRAGDGPIWHNTEIGFNTCKDNFLPTLFFAGNLFPTEIVPYTGCFQQAWPLQIDLQLCLVVPFIAMVYWKSAVAGNTLSGLLIVANMLLNMHYTFKYDLKIGFVHVNNYYLMEGIIAKPWTKLSNVGHGFIMAHLYIQILKYRGLESDQQKQRQFPTIHKFHKSRLWGVGLIWVALAIVLGNLTYPRPYNGDPESSSKLHNALYYAISRTSWVTACLLILLSIFCGHFAKAKALLGGSNMRLVAKSLAIACLL
mmetsp:Transcript_2676/g.4502  ORF Transcript_2676/g.4502 Transcript_2676/m.4502 type:complete len:478 (-) Transcript_2676:445-1878(-)